MDASRKTYGPAVENCQTFSTEDYRAVGSATHQTIRGLLTKMIGDLSEGGDNIDAGPIVQGALFGVFDFCLGGNVPPDAIRALVLDLLDSEAFQQLALMRAKNGSKN